jgi:hypothetical protein
LKLVSAANGVLGDGIRSAQEIDRAIDSAPALPVAFPKQRARSVNWRRSRRSSPSTARSA